MLGFISFLKESILITENRIKFFAKQANMPEDKVERLSQADPNPKKKNLGWLIKQHKADNIRSDMMDDFHPDDMRDHKNALNDFEELKKKDPKSSKHLEHDIGKYSDVNHLNSSVNDYNKTHGEEAKQAKWGEKVFDQDGHHIYHASTNEQATNHGRGSAWCTRIHDGNYQNKYLNNGDLYIHYPKGTPKPGEDGHEDGGSGRHQFWIPHHPEEESSEPELRSYTNGHVHDYNHLEDHPVLNKSPHFKEFQNAVTEHQARQENEDEDEDEDEDDFHDLVHSHIASERAEAVRHGAHTNGEYEHLYDDDHPEVKKSIIDYDTANFRMSHSFDHFSKDESPEVREHLASKLSNHQYINMMHNTIPAHGTIDHHGNETDHETDNPDHYSVMKSLAKNPHSPRSVHESIINNEKGFPAHAHSSLMEHIAANREAHRKNGNYGHPSNDSELMHKILDQNTHLSYRTFTKMTEHVGMGRGADPQILNRLIDHSNPEAAHAVAKSHGDMPSVQPKLKEHGDPRVQAAMAQHIPEHYINNSNLAVKAEAARYLKDGHPELSKALDHLSNDTSHSSMKIVSSRGTSDQINKPHILNSKDRNVNENLEYRLRKGDFDHHNELLKSIAHSTNNSLKIDLAQRTTNPEVLHHMKNDTNRSVILNVLQNPYVSHDTVHHMSEHNEAAKPLVARAIESSNKDTSHHLNNAELHTKLAKGTNEDAMAMIAGGSPHHEALRTLANRKKHGWSVVVNPNTPHDLLNHYANHESQDMRDFARNEIKQRQNVSTE